ncbi:MAG: T9SS type A sorting domain-containing protein [Bacteroidales bacterium]|nr:T9SS type A sorting domain-containing protein [Bacteroidales bacterium]
MYNDKGGAYIPEYNINTIGDIEFRDGYHLFTTEDTTIYFEGTPVVPSAWNIALEAGKWNSIAYISQESNPITSAFPASMHDSIEIVQTSSGHVWIPSLAVNTIGNMQPGVGYQVATSANINFSFAYNLLKSGSFKVQEANTNTQYFSYTKTGLLYTVVIDVSALADLEAGDEIAVFDGKLCVGAVVYEGGDVITVATWEGYAKNGVNLVGFKAGNEIAVKISKAKSHALVSLSTKDNDTFKSGYYSVIKVSDNTSSITADVFDFGAVKVYPNPFSDRVNISIPDAALVKGINIVNVSGEVIAELPVAGTIEWNATGKADGIYFVNIRTKNNIFSTRIVLQK